MKNLIEKFINFFEKYEIPLESKFLIGVSGGIDSMALLQLSLDANLNIEVAHVSYQLRKQENEVEISNLKEFCEKNSITLHLKKVLLDKSKNTQNEARDVRYQFFDKIINTCNLDYILTAHHKNDDHETFLNNAIRGCGLKGIKGIPEKRKKILRPVLQFSKIELLEYANSKRVPFYNDSSNFEDLYNRNFLRNTVLKNISTRFPNYEIGLSKTIENLKRDYLVLEDLVEKIVSPYIEKKNQNIIVKYDKNIPINCWYHFFKKYGFNFDQISNCFNSKFISGKFIKSNNFRLIKDREYWILCPVLTDINNKKIKLELNQNYKFPIKLELIEQKRMEKIDKNKNIGLFDLSNINFPLTLRKWEYGDFMKPLGTNGKKKISDILIDKKVSIVEKENIYVILSNNEIIWLIGYCISDKYKLNSITQNVLKITYFK